MQKYPLTNKGAKYARDVASGKIDVCEFVILACKRHLSDLKKQKESNFPYKFDKNIAEKACSFAEMLPFVKGKWSGSTIILEPWEAWILTCIFGWVKKKNGLRRYREAVLEIPRKNGKSVLAAIIGLIMLILDGEPGAEIYTAATSEVQAYEVFRPAWEMVRKTLALKNYFGINLAGTEKNPGNIYCDKTEGRMETVIGKPGDGASPHCWIMDEMHEAKTSDSYDTGKTGMGSREQPLMLVVSTSGTNTSYPFFQIIKQSEKILRGEIERPDLFTVIYTIDNDDDWTDFNVWKKANPNYGVSIFPDYLKSQHKIALQDARKQNILKCKHLNLWSNAGQAFFNMVDFQKSADPLLSINDFYGKPCFAGLDLASKKDLAALMLVFRRDEKYYMFSKYYIPGERTHGEDLAHYAGWVHQGYITATPGARIDFEYIKKDILQIAKNHDLTGVENGGGEICNDPWNAQQLVTELMDEGISVVEISQTVNMLSEPMKELDALIGNGQLIHDGNPVTYWCFANTMARIDKKDNVFPFKEGEENKIDGAVAAINAFCRAMRAENTKSVYEERGIMCF